MDDLINQLAIQVFFSIQSQEILLNKSQGSVHKTKQEPRQRKKGVIAS